MALRAAALEVYFAVYNSSTGARVTGDAANLSMVVGKDGADPVAATNAAETHGNLHSLLLTAAEMTAACVVVDGTSVTENAVVVPVTILTETAARAGDEMDLVAAPNGTAVTAIQNGLALESGGQLDTIATDVAGLDGEAMRGTDSAALATTALNNLIWTNAKAAFLDGSVLGVAALVWDRLTAALTTAGSIGAWILSKLDAPVSTVGGTIVLSAESSTITVSASGEGVGSTGALTLTRGANVTFAFEAVGKVLTGHSLYCTVRPDRDDRTDATDATAVFSKACTVTGATTFSLALTPTETDLLTLGTTYYYEIRDVTAADPLIISHIVVKGSVVKRTT